MRVKVVVWSKENVDWGSLTSVHGLGERGSFPEWCLCRNLTDTSIHLPLVVLPKGLGLTWDVGHSRRDVTSGWRGAVCASYPPASGCVHRLPVQVQAALGRCEDSG